MKRNLALALVGIVAVAGIAAVLFGSGAKPPLSSSTTSQSPAVDKTVAATTKYSSSDVAKHASADDCWTIVDGGVYNITDYISKHPGGQEILRACGVDATQLFNGTSPSGRSRAHSSDAVGILASYKVGVVQ